MSNNNGIFYMLTATEVQHIKDVLTELMGCAEPGSYNDEEVHQAINLLSKLEALDTEQVLTTLEINTDDLSEV